MEQKHYLKAENIFTNLVRIQENWIFQDSIDDIDQKNQAQTQQIFSEKWSQFEQGDNKRRSLQFSQRMYIKLYGFESEESLKQFLFSKKTIIDTGCGLGYKAAWFAELAPHAIVIGVDISEAAKIAAKNYKHLSNLYFYQADIANTGIKENKLTLHL